MKIKRQYIHQDWEITVFEDGSFERNAVTYPALLDMDARIPKYRLHPESLEKMENTKLRRIAMNLLVAATERLNDG